MPALPRSPPSRAAESPSPARRPRFADELRQSAGVIVAHEAAGRADRYWRGAGASDPVDRAEDFRLAAETSGSRAAIGPVRQLASSHRHPRRRRLGESRDLRRRENPRRRPERSAVRLQRVAGHLAQVEHRFAKKGCLGSRLQRARGNGSIQPGTAGPSSHITGIRSGSLRPVDHGVRATRRPPAEMA